MAFSFKERAISFTHAFRGIYTLVKTQHNALIHLTVTLTVVVSGFLLSIEAGDWALLVIAICIVWVAEALNTAIEFLSDAVTLEWNEAIGKAKDVAASAVLVASIAAAICEIFKVFTDSDFRSIYSIQLCRV